MLKGVVTPFVLKFLGGFIDDRKFNVEVQANKGLGSKIFSSDFYDGCLDLNKRIRCHNDFC